MMKNRRHRFHVREAGDPTKPPMVLVHGFMAHSMAFRRVEKTLGREHRLLMVDLPGHGNDQTFRERGMQPTLESLRDWILDFQDVALDAEPARWIGHSLGGLLAYEVARERPELVTDLVLASPAVRVPDQPLVSRLLDRFPARVATLGVNRLGLSLYQPLNWRGEPMSRAEEAEYLAPMRSRERMDFILRLGARMLDGNHASLGPVDPRTLVIWGEHDHMLPPEDAWWVGERLGADVHIVQGSGHSPMEDTPGRFVELVTDFLG